MGHDLCYGECSGIANPKLRNSCVSMCDRSLIDDLNKLNEDPRKWPRPPRPGTEADSRNYCDLAKQNFLCSGYPEKCKRK